MCSQTTVHENNSLRISGRRQRLAHWLCASLVLLLTPAWGAKLRLHVPSPDWRDQVIYFAVTDRFDDGDPRNNDQGAGEYKPGDRTRYQGGDLAGLRRRLAYIQGLGATALWITPPVANQWLDPSNSYSGYHGYWAQHFMQVDPHLGTLADYQRLSDGLHRRGMVLVQDIVLNHTGNYFSYGERWRAGDAAHGYEAHAATPPVARPTQWPFSQNDARVAAQRTLGIYHWTPDVTDYADPAQEHNYQMSGLDDLNTENPLVRKALRQSYGHWIKQVGVDAFRVDTAFYVPPDSFADFLRARDRRAPGIEQVARATGRRNFYSFGEGFAIDKAFEEKQARKIESYRRSASGQPLLPGMLNFPLYAALGDAFARGRPTAELAHRITSTMQRHPRPHLMANFLDNHDVDRFLAGGSEAGLRQALLALFTLPGIPVITYGTEQGFTEARGSMFTAGWGSGGRDRFDTRAPLYRLIAELAALRRQDRVFSRGTPTVLAHNAAAPGVIAWRTGQGRARRWVMLNTAEHEALAANVATGLAPGTVLVARYALPGQAAPELVVGAGGLVSVALPARAGWVWQVGRQAAAGQAPQAAGPTMAAVAAQAAGDFDVSGNSPGAAPLQLVVDGNLAQATAITPATDGSWRARVDTSAWADPRTVHSLTAWAGRGDGGDTGGLGAASGASATQTVRVQRAWREVLDASDPEGDDRGPTGRYQYPSDPGYARRQMDLRRVRAFTSGGALLLELTTQHISTAWNPANGFDRVAFTVFIELPGQEGGATVMPLQDAQLPQGMRWHLRLRAHGWSNALFGWQGASATQEGQAMAGAPAIAVDTQARTVRLSFSAAALGKLPSLAGLRLYVTTWDYDGGYRALAAQAGPYVMGGGGAGEAKVMDDTAVLTLAP